MDSTLSNHSEITKMTMKMVRLAFYLLFYIHLTACIQFYIISQEKAWIPQMMRFESPEDFYDSDYLTKYLVSLNLSVLLLTGNDVLPETNLHILSTSLLMLTGAIYLANIFGTITVIVSSLNRK